MFGFPRWKISGINGNSGCLPFITIPQISGNFKIFIWKISIRSKCECLARVFAMVVLQLLLIDKILEDGKFYKMVEDNDDIIVSSAIFTFMKRNLWFGAIRVIFYD